MYHHIGHDGHEPDVVNQEQDVVNQEQDVVNQEQDALRMDGTPFLMFIDVNILNNTRHVP